MKKRFLALLCALSLLAGLMACGRPADASASVPASSPASSPVVSEPPAPTKTPATVYLPDDNAEHLIPTTVEVETPAGEELDDVTVLTHLVEQLAREGALPADTELLSMKLGDPVAVDMNAAFGEGMKSTGTTGEFLYLGALVNTILDYTGAESVLLTVEGEILETGHSIYDEPVQAMDR